MAKKSEVYEGRRNNRISNLVKAMQGWNDQLTVSTSTPSGKFGRVVYIDTGGVRIDGSQLDVEFNIPFDDDTEANEASITIYNLSSHTVSMIKSNASITVTAGHTGDTGIVFSGYISKVNTKWSGNDKVTTISAIDYINLKERDVESISYNSGVKASYILRDLVGRLGLPIAVFQTRRDYTYKDGASVSGGLMAAVKQYAEVCGVSAYINKSKIYVRHLSDGDDIGFTINTDTGLVDSPEEFTEEVQSEDYTDTVHGLKFKILLEHRITTASVITLKSRNFSGKFRVREGNHVCSESDFYTEVTVIDG